MSWWTKLGIGLGVCTVVFGGIGYAAGRYAASPRGKGVSKFHREALAQVPREAVAAGSLDVGGALEALIDENLGLVPVVADPDDLRRELSKLSVEHFGVDLLESERAVAWVTPAGAAAVLIEGDFEGTPKGQEGSEAGGAMVVRLRPGLFAAVTEKGLLVGTEDGVRKGAEVVGGKADSVSGSETASKAHDAVLGAVGDGVFIVSGALPEGLLPAPGSGLEAAAASLAADGSIGIALQGEKEALDAVEKAYRDGVGAAKEAVSSGLSELREARTGEAVLGLLLAKHKLEDLAAWLEPKRDGDVLTVSASGMGGVAAVYFGGAAAGLAGRGQLRGLKRALKRFGRSSDCERALDHFADLVRKSDDLGGMRDSMLERLESGSGRAEFLEECEREPAARIRCSLKAESIEELGRCSQGGPDDD